MKIYVQSLNINMGVEFDADKIKLEFEAFTDDKDALKKLQNIKDTGTAFLITDIEEYKEFLKAKFPERLL